MILNGCVTQNCVPSAMSKSVLKACYKCKEAVVCRHYVEHNGVSWWDEDMCEIKYFVCDNCMSSKAI